MKTTGKIIMSLLFLGLSSTGCRLAHETAKQQPQIDELPVVHTESFTVNAPLNKVYDFVVAEDVLPKILKKYLFIPAVSGATIHQGNWVTPGSYRTVHFANGDTLREELTNFDRPAYFAYKVSSFSGFQRHLASYGTGQWWFKASGDQTEVKWTYTFYAKNKFKHFLLRPFINHDFRTYMKHSISQIKQQTEHGN